MWKQKVKQSQIIVLLGFFLSTSLFFYLPLHFQILGSVSEIVWALVISVSTFAFYSDFILFILCFFLYLNTKQCVFLLEICEYFLLPISGFSMLQEISLNNQQSLLSTKRIFLFIFYVSTLVMAAFKIHHTNQSYLQHPGRTILKFESPVRFWRVIKFASACFMNLVFEQKIYHISLVICNCLDFVMVFSQFTFVQIELQKCLMIANFNNILSSLIMGYFNFELSASSFLWSVLIQIIFMVLYFSFEKKLHPVFEFKYILLLKEMKSNKVDFYSERSKKITICLLECFHYFYRFDAEKKIMINEQKTQEWSQNFLTRFKMSYMVILIAFMEHLEIENNQLKVIRQSQKMKTTQRIRNTKITKTFVWGDLNTRIAELYLKVYHKKKTPVEILENKCLFFNFLSFCIDTLDEKYNPEHPWSYSNEFFLTFATKLDKKFIMKKMQFCQRRSFLTQQSIFYRARNTKATLYLKGLRVHYGIRESQMQLYMLFEERLQKLKDKIIEVCTEDIQFYQILSNKIGNIFDLQKHLLRRLTNKKQVEVQFEQCFNQYHYINFEQFTYVFLLFNIAFCKQISKTQQIIHLKFRLPHSCIKSGRQELIYRDNKKMSLTPILVCSGLDVNTYAFGDILMSNAFFRQKFGVRKNSVDFKAKKLNDLLIDDEQRQKHSYLMNQSFKFSQSNEALTKQEHRDYDCYLKINLLKNDQLIVQNFRVSTKIFWSLETLISYICVLEQKGSQKYIVCAEQNADEIHTTKSRSKSPNILEIEQLGTEVTLKKITEGQVLNLEMELELKNNGVQSQFVSIDCGGSKTMQVDFDDKEQKYKRAENKLESSSSNFSARAKASISLIFFIIAILAFMIISSIAVKKASQVQNRSKQIENLLSGPQSCHLIFGQYLYLMQKISLGKIPNQICFPYIMDLNQFSKYQIRQCLTNKIPNYLQQYFSNSTQVVPLLNTTVANPTVSAQNPHGLGVDYANLLSFMSSNTEYYLNTDLASLTGPENAQFLRLLQNFTLPFDKSFQQNFFEDLINKNMQNLSKIENQHVLSFALGTFSIIVILLLSVTSIICLFYEAFKHYELLNKIENSYFDKVGYGIKEIVRQIEKMKDCRFNHCHFVTDNDMVIKTKTVTEIFEKEYTLPEFERMVCNDDDSELRQAKEQHVKKQLSPIRSILLGKKNVFIVLFVIFVINATLTTLIWSNAKSIIVNHQNLGNIYQEASITRFGLSEVQLSTWMLFMNQNQIRSPQQIKQSFYNSIAELKKQKFFLLFYDMRDSILQKTLYLKICPIIAKSLNLTVEGCEMVIGQLSTLTVSDLVSYSTETFESFIERQKYESSIGIQQKMCSVFMQNFYLTIPGLVQTWQTLLLVIDQECQKFIEMLVKILYITMGLSILIFSIVIWMDLQRGNAVKHEVLKIGTIENLYERKEYKPFINKVYYRLEN